MITIRLAGVNVGIKNTYDLTPRLAGWITDAAPDFTVELGPYELKKEDPRFSPDYVEFICVYRRIAERIPAWDAFVCHGTVVAMDGRAYIFTAPSGTGKTTHTQLWLKRFGDRAWILSGDKPILRRTERGFLACGTPWRGKENYGVNAELPVQGICLLDRGEINEIAPATPADMLRFLSRQIYYPRQADRMEKLLELLDAFCSTVPTWTMRCNMDIEAAEVAYEAMRPREENSKCKMQNGTGDARHQATGNRQQTRP